jgi:hypothetical protein
MSEFSELLDYHVRQSGVSNSGFAKKCNIDRTLMQKYLSGQRLPRNGELVDNIYNKLHLTPDEKVKIEDAYQKELLGSQMYEQRKAVKQIIEDFSEIVHCEKKEWERSCAVNIDAEKLPVIMPVEGKHDMIGTFWGILQYEMMRQDCELFMIFQPEYNELENILFNLLQNTHTIVHHIVCFDQNRGEKRQYNLQILKNLIPFIFGKGTYDVRFYYGYIENEVNTMRIMPNMIITNSFVILFDSEMKKGIVYKSEEMHNFYMGIYKDMEKKTSNFLKKHENIIENMNYYMEQHPCNFSMQADPCMAYALSEKILRDVLNPEIEEFADAAGQLVNMMNNWGKLAVESGEPANTNFFTPTGLKHFMDEGRLLEFSYQFYSPIPEHWRIQMLETFSEELRSGLLEAYMIDEDELKLDPKLVIQQCGDDAVHFICLEDDGSQMSLRIYEDSIVSAFADFLQGMKESFYVRSKEDTLEYIRKTIDEYKNKWADILSDKS